LGAYHENLLVLKLKAHKKVLYSECIRHNHTENSEYYHIANSECANNSRQGSCVTLNAIEKPKMYENFESVHATCFVSGHHLKQE